MPVYSPLTVDVAIDGLADDEQAKVTFLAERLTRERGLLEGLDDYYNGEQRVADLGISTPPALEGLHTITGWPGLVVDSLDERLTVEGFRYPNSPTADDDLWAIWQANNLDEESALAHLDALIYGRSFVMVGAAPDGGVPLITVESPVNMAARWDARTRAVTSALQVYEMDGQEAIALYLPTVTVHLTREENAPWETRDRDEHKLGVCPVVMVANRQRSNDRYGRSEITPAVQSLTDAACRTLLNLEAGREFYAVPQKYALGVAEEDFKDAQGNDVSKWEAAISKVWAIERDEDGNVPEVGQFTAMNPVVFTGIVDMYSKLMAAITGLPPHFFGQTTDNPASADAIRSAEARLNKKAERRQRAFSGGWEGALRIALAIANGGELPIDAQRIETTWASPATPTPSATAAAIVPQVQAGIIPATSDVTLEKLGYSPLERQRIAADRDRSAGQQFLAQIAQSLEAKEARTDTSLAKDLSTDGTAPPPDGSDSAAG